MDNRQCSFGQAPCPPGLLVCGAGIEHCSPCPALCQSSSWGYKACQIDTAHTEEKHKRNYFHNQLASSCDLFFPDRVDNLLLNVFHILCTFSLHLLLLISYGISNFLAPTWYQDGTRWLLARTDWLKHTEITDHTLLLAINTNSLFISN